MFANLPSRVSVFEVGPRDGLQNEAAFVPTEGKLELIRALSDAGLRRIEATSFVNPRWIPALADADRLASWLPSLDSPARFSALVPNPQGLERAFAAKLPEVAVFMSASETHNQRNLNRTREATLRDYAGVFARCAEAGVAVRAYVSTVLGCPYEGDVAPEAVAEISLKLLELGAYEVSLGDTIGVGTPLKTFELLCHLERRIPLAKLALHLHDTRGTALANCLVGLEVGITTYDASVGGLGGCPYAPGASGNLATEDLVHMLHAMGVETGVDLPRLVEAGLLAQRLLNRKLPGRALAALSGARSLTRSVE